MANESLILDNRGKQVGSMLGYRPSTADAAKPIPIEIPYSRNSDAMEFVNGLWQPVVKNMPRRYNDAWLNEPFATNINTRSYQAASWAGTGAGVNGTTTSPDGTTNASTINLLSGQYLRNPLFTITENITYTASAFVKNNGLIAGETYRFYVNNNSGTGMLVHGAVDIVNGTITLTASIGATSVSAKIESYPNGWYRISLTFTVSAGRSSGSAEFGFDGLSIASGSLYMWGAQLEVGSTATSPIITAGSSVTRLADNVSKTGASEIIGQTEGTIFVDVVINSENNPSANVINGAKNTNSSFAILRIKATKAIRAFIYNSTVLKADITGGSYNLGDRLKIAYGYKSGDSVLYVNGVQIGTSADAISFPATLSELTWDDATTYFGYQEAENINESRISKTRLPNAELAALTTI